MFWQKLRACSADRPWVSGGRGKLRGRRWSAEGGTSHFHSEPLLLLRSEQQRCLKLVSFKRETLISMHNQFHQKSTNELKITTIGWTCKVNYKLSTSINWNQPSQQPPWWVSGPPSARQLPEGWCCFYGNRMLASAVAPGNWMFPGKDCCGIGSGTWKSGPRKQCWHEVLNNVAKTKNSLDKA